MMTARETHQPNVLLYLGKFPGYGFDVDGGSILARQLIDSLKYHCNLTLVFIRKNGEIYTDLMVQQIKYVEYKNPYGNKFERRMQNLDTNRQAIGVFDQYDIIVTAHISKFFGFENAPQSFWDKTVLFPMFCTSSYKRSGEIVPSEYTKLEHFVLNHVKKIITPSIIESYDLQQDYGVDEKKISIVYRGINPVFTYSSETNNWNSPRIVSIGSIKKQKNNLSSLLVLNHLLESGLDVTLDCIGTIQDKELYEMMLSYIKSNQLTQKVAFHFEQTQEQVAKVVKSADINISTSNWETFGRGIFEGISCGLPTFVFSRLTSVQKICEGNTGVVFVENEEEMAKAIINVMNSPSTYYQMKDSLKTLAERVSYDRERKDLIKQILNKDV